MNCTRMRVVISASITIPSDSVLAKIALRDDHERHVRKCFVGWTRANALKNVPSTLPAYGILE